MKMAIAIIALCAALSAQGQTGNDQIVIRPFNPVATSPFQIDVPAEACFISSPTPPVLTSSVQVAGNTITILVTQPSFACFSAGDPLVYRPVTFTVGPLPAGIYQVNYMLSNSAPVLQRSTTFAVGALPEAVPTLSKGGLALLVLMLVGTTLYMKRRTGSK